MGAVNFTIMNTTILISLEIVDLNKRKAYCNSIINILVSPTGHVPIAQYFDDAWMLWDSTTNSM